MKILLLVLICAPVRASGADPGFPGPGEPYWLKTYSTSPVRDYWTGTLTAADPAKSFPKIMKAVAAESGQLTAPVETFAATKDGSQRQLVWVMPLKRGKALLKRLRKLGELPDPLQRTEGAPIPLAEVRAKSKRLMKEESEQAAALAKVPATAAAAREILEHLLLVQEVAERSEPQLFFSLTVKKK